MNNENINEEFTALADELEQESTLYPTIFELKCWFLTILGYSFLFIVIFSSNFLTCIIFSNWPLLSSDYLSTNPIFEFYGYSAVAIAAFSFIEINHLTGLTAPKGYRLKPLDYPQLFERLSKIKKQSNSEKIDQVILKHGHTLEVFQKPRFLSIKRNSTVLSIGFELFLIMSPTQMTALLAQMSHGLSDTRNAYLRTNTMVITLLKSLSFWCGKSRFLQKLVIRIDHYTTTLSLHRAVVSRAITFSADKAAANQVGVNHVVEAMLKQQVLTRYINQSYWLSVDDLINVLPEPVVSPYRQLISWLPQQSITHEDLGVLLGQLYAEPSSPWDNRPNLKERLTALEAKALFSLSFQLSAAEVYFGRRYDKVLADMDLDWWQQFQPIWRKYFQEHQGQQLSQPSETGVTTNPQP